MQRQTYFFSLVPIVAYTLNLKKYFIKCNMHQPLLRSIVNYTICCRCCSYDDSTGFVTFSLPIAVMMKKKKKLDLFAYSVSTYFLFFLFIFCYFTPLYSLHKLAAWCLEYFVYVDLDKKKKNWEKPLMGYFEENQPQFKFNLNFRT